MGTRSRLPRLERLEDRRLLSVAPPVVPSPVPATLPTQVETSWTQDSGSAALDRLAGLPRAAGFATGMAAAAANTGVFRVYVEQGLLAQIRSAIDTYAADLAAEGYRVGVEEFSGTAAQLRASLQNHWVNDHLEGAVFVGDLPTMEFTSQDHWNNTLKTVTYLHDMYFMDLNGTYTFNAGGLDSHTGAVAPDIYVSRITTSNLGGVTGRNEATLINDYLAKVHAYRTGQLAFADRGIVVKDDEWTSWVESGKADLYMSSLYSDVQTIIDPAQTTKQGYLDTLQVNAESTLEVLHGDATRHALKVGPDWQWITSQEIVDANPRQGFYNMFNCSGADFGVDDNLIGSYVYGGSYGLNAVGTTKTGGMFDYQTFYEAQGRGESLGQAFRDWYDEHTVATDEVATYYWVDWFYGMTMQGDPTLKTALPPTAALVDPSSAAVVSNQTLNGRHTIDVAYSTSDGGGLNPSTVSDSAAEFTLTGAAAKGVVVKGAPQAIGGNVYRYTFTGSFGAGPVSVNFIAGSFADKVGIKNKARSFTFTVVPTVSVSGVSVREGKAGTTKANFTVTLSTRSSETITVNYGTQDGTATAESDYTAIAGGTLTFKAGETRKIITVGVGGDTLYEDGETFAVKLAGATGAAIGQGTATGTIQNDDAAPTLSISNVSYAEGIAGTTPFAFKVTLSRDSSLPVTVHYATSNGTAAFSSDYTAASGDLTFLPGQTQQTITVEVNGDTMYEVNETFRVSLGSLKGATLVRDKGVGTGTILNDDDMPMVSISDAKLVPTAAGASAEFVVALSAPSGVPATVKVATSNGEAKARSDYTAVGKTLVFDVGQTVKSIFVPISGNLSTKAGKTFFCDALRPQAGHVRRLGQGDLHDPAPGLGAALGCPGRGDDAFAIACAAARPPPWMRHSVC